MTTNNTSDFNANHLKLTPEKLAEWGKRCSSTTLITSRYFQQNQNKDDNNMQDHGTNSSNEVPQEHEHLHHTLLPKQEDSRNNSHVVALSNDLQVDNMSLDVYQSDDYFDLSEDYVDHDMQEPNNETSTQEQVFSPIYEDNESSFSLSNVSNEDSLNLLQNVSPVEKQKILDQENTLHEESREHSNQERYPTNNINHDLNKQLDKISPNLKNLPSKVSYEENYINPNKLVFSYEKYNKMKESSRLRASNPNISHFMKIVIPNKKSDFNRDMEEILCDIEAHYELVQEGQLEVNQQLDYIERSLDSLNKELNKYRVKLCDLRQECCSQIQINVLKESEEWESAFDRIGTNIY